MDLPLVSIITINYNEVEMTTRCLERLRSLTYPNVEVFAVDNASVEGQAKALAERFPEVTVIANDTNDGFAGGNNVALRRARGQYVLLLNNDALPEPGLLGPLVETMEARPDVGIASPKIVFADGEEETGRRASSTPDRPPSTRTRAAPTPSATASRTTVASTNRAAPIWPTAPP